ncbi:MAG: IclR family transcriptional regulator [Woeseiaceae bacterium]|nr:IclR family transcriptional regulator [Woeseiaceae bacterium]
MKPLAVNTRSPQGAQSALRAMRLLKLFTPERPELQLRELSHLAGLNKTTTHRLLQALASEAMLERSTDSGGYRLGPALIALGMQALAGDDLRSRARPLLASLAAETGETATLEVPVEDTMLILDEVSGGHRVAAGGNVGTRWAMHVTSTGKAFIAFGQDGMARLGERLTPLTARTITDRDKLAAQLDEIRRRGFAETIDELEDGFAGVGTVVRGRAGEVVAAMSICGPTQRLTESRRASLGATLCAAAGQLQPGY